MEYNSDWNIKRQEYSHKKTQQTRKIVSYTLAFLGVAILASQLIPLAVSFASGKIYEIKAATLAKPIPDSHKETISGQFAYYNPGQSYFQNLIAKAGESAQENEYSYNPVTKTMIKIVINKEYQRDMKLSIKDVGIVDVKVSSNVESYDEKVYNLKLKNGLAHFKGTPLPGDGGNSFIYGHSAVPSFFNRHQNLSEVIFSRLEKVDIGAEVEISREGQKYVYIVRNKKIVEPSDFSVLQSNGDKEVVTLMTCWPLGVPSKRLIVVAERYE